MLYKQCGTTADQGPYQRNQYSAMVNKKCDSMHNFVGSLFYDRNKAATAAVSDRTELLHHMNQYHAGHGQHP